MTMHLAHPSLTLGGKRKGKQKFRNAEEARKARELAQDWERKQAEWKSMSNPVPKSFTMQKVSISPKVPVGRESQKIPSLGMWVKGAVNVKQPQQYTGDKILGIGTMHKSNAVPIFTDQQAKDISTMRRG
jgi:hypothetical protein